MSRAWTHSDICHFTLTTDTPAVRASWRSPRPSHPQHSLRSNNLQSGRVSKTATLSVNHEKRRYRTEPFQMRSWQPLCGMNPRKSTDRELARYPLAERVSVRLRCPTRSNG